ncbi:cyclase family protein [Halococcus sp. IIIV-5B]|uniref:cyclase family protein n=1 Tax=Halococcus sp. IIIV-5B TaxID=2321230 RepID=UPI000E772BC3|nr:cyclase family protein [Halococcus sp. IIIV-5B]RJT01469.1 cyclase family protein [Halococcus sp. IIIV-5B]
MQVDLTHRIETEMTVYPGDPPVCVEPHAVYDQDGYRVSVIQLGSHTGTHIDAPSHVLEEGRTLDTYAIEQFTFEAARIDCTGLSDREPITVENVPDDDIDLALFWTGWSTHWGTERYLDHPYLAPDAAAVCAERGYAVGIDTLSPDPTRTQNSEEIDSTGLQAHHTLLGADNLIIENLRNLGELSDRFELRAYPVALGGDGAPVRAVGTVDE